MNFSFLKSVGLCLFVFTGGIALSISIENSFRKLIQFFLRITSHNSIQFYGKEFHLFAKPYYYLSFGLFFLALLFIWKFSKTRKFTLTLLPLLGLPLFIYLTCYFYGFAKIVECTACQNGIRNLHYNEVWYEGIILFSLLLSLIPTFVFIVSNRRNSKPI